MILRIIAKIQRDIYGKTQKSPKKRVRAPDSPDSYRGSRCLVRPDSYRDGKVGPPIIWNCYFYIVLYMAILFMRDICCSIIYSDTLKKFYTSAFQKSLQERIEKHNSHFYGKHKYTAAASDW